MRVAAYDETFIFDTDSNQIFDMHVSFLILMLRRPFSSSFLLSKFKNKKMYR